MTLIKNNLVKTLLLIILVAYIFVLPIITTLADTNPVPPAPAAAVKLKNPIQQESIIAFIKDLLTGAIKIGIPIIALAIVYCGFLFVAARGNSEKLTKAKDALLYTCIGGAILLGSWAIANMLSNTVSGLG